MLSESNSGLGFDLRLFSLELETFETRFYLGKACFTAAFSVAIILGLCTNVDNSASGLFAFLFFEFSNLLFLLLNSSLELLLHFLSGFFSLKLVNLLRLFDTSIGNSNN